MKIIRGKAMSIMRGRGIRKHRYSLILSFSLAMFFVLLWAIALAAVAVYLLVYFEVIGSIEEMGVGTIVLLMALISLIIGATVSFFAMKMLLKPVNKWINNMNRLASGDFGVRMKFGKPLGNNPTFLELTDSFNTLAEELQNTEMLRSDFINNISHEFKTPIVSISGLARLMKSGDLSESERMEYLDAIEEESLRLTSMATNVLNLIKVENQAILSSVSQFNLSEQLRSCLLLLENKWTKKDLDLNLDFDEHTVSANEELLKQVWINLLDNAVKFCDVGGTVSVDIKEETDVIYVSVGNTGSEIPADKMEKIFRKYYQVDESHSTEGNGVGLAIVLKIVELHGGSVTVKSEDGVTVFTVELPKM